MKILLVGINSKFIHSNLAIYSLREFASPYKKNIFISEYTINQPIDTILEDIFLQRPDIIAFSCYIWNYTYVLELVAACRQVLPQTKIWVGGPEVSYDAIKVLEENAEIDIVIKGEGEETFAKLVAHHLEENGNSQGEGYEGIAGICYRDEEGRMIDEGWPTLISLDGLPFIYRNGLSSFENKIIYYESSRGCPFACSYCLSSIDKSLRFKSLSLVNEELQVLLDYGVSQVKFVDRTFNCNHEHALSIWHYILEHDNGLTNFHFEITADILQKEEVELLQKMRPGLVQLEVGVQSTNMETLHAISRNMDFRTLSQRILELQKNQNIHLHLDLIAGLPYEDYNCFQSSFNQVFSLFPEQLQLGFLKVLKGSKMYDNREEFKLVYQKTPPYEVRSTKWISYEEILCLKRVEKMLEIYYNSGQFTMILSHLLSCFESPFSFFLELGNFFEKVQPMNKSHSRLRIYEILLDFGKMVNKEQEELYREALTFDYYLREKPKSRPQLFGEWDITKEESQRFYQGEVEHPRYLQDYEGYDKKQLSRMTHIERFHYVTLSEKEPKEQVILFDYKKSGSLRGGAHTSIIFL